MTDIDDDLTLLTPAEVVGLQRQIEAGVLAREARESGTNAAGATETELRVLEEQGERARQRFISANLRLVKMVARQIAIRSDLSEADLFQQGCLGLITAVARSITPAASGSRPMRCSGSVPTSAARRRATSAR